MLLITAWGLRYARDLAFGCVDNAGFLERRASDGFRLSGDLTRESSVFHS